jgi:hypothetical protein
MRLVVLCGKTVVDLDRVVAVVGNVVTFMPNMERIPIPKDAAEELLGLLKREQEERDGAGEKGGAA